MSVAWSELTWPLSRVDDAVAALAQRAGLPTRPLDFKLPHTTASEAGDRLGRRVESTAEWLGVEAEEVEEDFSNLDSMLGPSGPAIFQLPNGAGLLAARRSIGKSLLVLTPALTEITVDAAAVRSALCSEVEASLSPTVEQILIDAQIPPPRHERTRRMLLHQLLAGERIGRAWLIRPAGGANVYTQARTARLPGLVVGIVASHFVEYSLWVASWGLLGWMTLEGRLHFGWLTAWFMLLLTVVPFRMLGSWAGGLFAVRASALIKQRLLVGTLKLQPEEIRRHGVGQLLGRVLESEAIESLAVGGGFATVLSIVELAIAGAVLAAGAGGLFHVVLLAITVTAAILLGLQHYRYRNEWTEQRLTMTHDLVEQMIGHRTRLAQEPRARWNDHEDEWLERYGQTSKKLDRQGVVLGAVLPRAWFIIGMLGLTPAFIAGGSSIAALAISLGGVLLAYQALDKFSDGFGRLSAAAIGWQRVRALWRAAERQEPIAQPGLETEMDGFERGRQKLIEGRNLVFRYPDRSAPVLKNVNVRISADDRLLLEGPSGGGKSTLAAVLAASRVPSGGLLLLNGLDRATIGASQWRRRVVMAPQFHDNYVFMGTLAFNALMGRAWPPRPADLSEAEEVCRSLGLGPLLDRMPSGLQQLVGESGWQLSHGEKSRLYIARALLQGAQLVILDESFAALDPVTLRTTLSLVLERAPTTLVVAHP